MKPNRLRLIGISLAGIACWWCATSESPLPSPRAAIAGAAPEAIVVTPDMTRACQSVVYQMVAFQRIVMDEKQSMTIRPLSAMDELVAEEYRIDTSKCPTDFRMAVMRFVIAEDSARTHAHLDKTGNADEILVAGMESFASQGLSAVKPVGSLNQYNQKIDERQKQDLANVQSAMLSLARVAMRYGVK